MKIMAVKTEYASILFYFSTYSSGQKYCFFRFELQVLPKAVILFDFQKKIPV